MNELQLDIEYTYKQICEILGWNYYKAANTGKKKQIAELERCYDFFHPSNPKTKKEKKSFVFTRKKAELDLTDGRINNHGLSKFEDEAFAFLWNYFIKSLEPNQQSWTSQTASIFFTSYNVYQKFGWSLSQYKVACRNDDVFNLFCEIVNGTLYQKTITKATIKYGELILPKSTFGENRSNEKKKHHLCKGIIYHTEKSNSKRSIAVDANEEMLYEYLKYEKAALSDMGCSSLSHCIKAGRLVSLYKRIEAYFSNNALEGEPPKYNIRKVNVLTFDSLDFFDFSIPEDFRVSENMRHYYQIKFRLMILDIVKESVLKRCGEILDKDGEPIEYSHSLNSEEKELLKDCYQQLEKQENMEEDKEYLAACESESGIITWLKTHSVNDTDDIAIREDGTFYTIPKVERSDSEEDEDDPF